MHGPCERLRTQRHGRADGGVYTLRHSSETLPSLDQFQVNNKAEGVWLARGGGGEGDDVSGGRGWAGTGTGEPQDLQW